MSDDDAGGDPLALREPHGNVAALRRPGLPHHPLLDRSVQGAIGEQLRRMYEHFVNQPLPSRLVELLGRIGPMEGWPDSARGSDEETRKDA